MWKNHFFRILWSLVLTCTFHFATCRVTGKLVTDNSEKWDKVYQRDDVKIMVSDPQALNVDSVKQYSGYFEAGSQGSHFFFWFFESRNKPETDPVILWLNGGPGCSSLEGLFFENGPSMIDSSLELRRNTFSWNRNANVIYLDQPIGTGFSYSEGDEDQVSSTVESSKQTLEFLDHFFQAFPEYSHQKFHIAGESYAGHYIPVLAYDILRAPSKSFNLSSVLIGNGLTDPLTQYNYYKPMACGAGGFHSVLSPHECTVMELALPVCQSTIDRCYSDPDNRESCQFAMQICQVSEMMPYQSTGLNLYDVRRPCDPESELCYSDLASVEKFLNQQHVKQEIGANTAITYKNCNEKINAAFGDNGDWMQPYHLKLGTVLNAGLPVLIYAGDKDFICNWLGNEAWTKNLAWAGQNQFNTVMPRPWNTPKGPAGEITNYGHFSFLRIYDAGHMVPHDQSENSWYMLNSWLNGDYGFEKVSNVQIVHVQKTTTITITVPAETPQIFF